MKMVYFYCFNYSAHLQSPDIGTGPYTDIPDISCVAKSGSNRAQAHPNASCALPPRLQKIEIL